MSETVGSQIRELAIGQSLWRRGSRDLQRCLNAMLPHARDIRLETLRLLGVRALGCLILMECAALMPYLTSVHIVHLNDAASACRLVRLLRENGKLLAMSIELASGESEDPDDHRERMRLTEAYCQRNRHLPQL
jgi:hypothetical protein